MKQQEWIRLIKRTGIMLFIVLAALAAVSGVIGGMLSKEWIDTASAITITNVIQVIAAFAVSFYACRQTPRRKMVTGICASGAFVCACLLAKGIFFSGEGHDFGIVFWLCVLAAVPVGIVSSQKKSRKR